MRIDEEKENSRYLRRFQRIEVLVQFVDDYGSIWWFEQMVYATGKHARCDILVGVRRDATRIYDTFYAGTWIYI